MAVMPSRQRECVGTTLALYYSFAKQAELGSVTCTWAAAAADRYISAQIFAGVSPAGLAALGNVSTGSAASQLSLSAAGTAGEYQSGELAVSCIGSNSTEASFNVPNEFTGENVAFSGTSAEDLTCAEDLNAGPGVGGIYWTAASSSSTGLADDTALWYSGAGGSVQTPVYGDVPSCPPTGGPTFTGAVMTGSGTFVTSTLVPGLVAVVVSLILLAAIFTFLARVTGRVT